MSTQYLVAFACIFGINLLPAFGPPTWAVLVFFRFNSDLAAVPLVLGGALAAACGRLVLAHASRHLRGRLGARRRANLEAAQHALTAGPRRAFAGLALFALSPIPSAQLFVAAGLLAVPLAPLTAAFFAGRLVSYSVYVTGASLAKDSLGSTFTHVFTSPLGIAVQLVMLAGVIALAGFPQTKRGITRQSAGDSGPRLVDDRTKSVRRQVMRSKFFNYGGIAAAVVLIAFGIGSLFMGISGRDTVRSNLTKEQIVGTPDMTPKAIAAEAKAAGLKNITLPTKSVAGQKVDTGSRARTFAEYMRVHALEATGGQVYSEMGRYLDKAGKPTNDAKAAAIDPKTQKPVENGARNLWVTETALSTALNTSYFAENVATFAIVMGVALLLTGIGFLVLTLGLVPGRRTEPSDVHSRSTTTAAAMG